MRDKLLLDVRNNDLNEIIIDIKSIIGNIELLTQNFDIILDILFNFDNANIIYHLNMCMLYIDACDNLLGMAIQMVNHPKYNYNKIKELKYMHDNIFLNEKIASKLFVYLLEDAFAYRYELMFMLDNSNITSLVNYICEEKRTKYFYKIIGLTTFYIKKTMTICFDFFEFDYPNDLIESMKNSFAYFYAWNYINSSREFIKEVVPKTNQQVEVLKLLDELIVQYGDECKKMKLSSDFSINPDIARARQKYDIESNKSITEMAEEKSIFYKLTNNVSILYGKNVVFYVDKLPKNKDELRKVQLQNFSISYEYPFDYFFDPVNYRFYIDKLLEGKPYEINH